MNIYIIEEDPIPQSRPRFTRAGQIYQPSRNKDFKTRVAWAVKSGGNVQPTDKPVELSLKFFRKFKPASRRFGDFDNLAKSITDALTGVLWVDDSQIVKATVEKCFTCDTPRTEIEFKVLP